MERPIQLPPAKIERVAGNYSQYNAESNNESRAGTEFTTEAVSDDSAVDEQGFDGLGTEMENRKRKSSQTTVTRSQAHSAAKKGCRTSALDQSSQATEDIIIIDDDSAMNGRTLNVMLDEFGEVIEQITKCKKQLKKLNEQEVIIRDKIRVDGENLNVLLDEFGAVREKLSEFKKQLNELSKQECIIRAKVHNCIK